MGHGLRRKLFDKGLIEQRRCGCFDECLASRKQFALCGGPLHIAVAAAFIGLPGKVERLGQIGQHCGAQLLDCIDVLLTGVVGLEQQSVQL